MTAGFLITYAATSLSNFGLKIWISVTFCSYQTTISYVCTGYHCSFKMQVRFRDVGSYVYAECKLNNMAGICELCLNI